MNGQSYRTDIDIAANAKRLYSTLMSGLKTGEITETKPINAKEIADRASKALSRKVMTEEVRQWVHYLRAKFKVPVGSSGDGYFYCSNKAQWLKTQKALIGRINNQKDAAYGPDEYYHKAEQQTLFQPPQPPAQKAAPIFDGELMNHPVVQALKENFGAVPV
jgi:hypothetical protein